MLAGVAPSVPVPAVRLISKSSGPVRCRRPEPRVKLLLAAVLRSMNLPVPGLSIQSDLTVRLAVSVGKRFAAVKTVPTSADWSAVPLNSVLSASV